MKKLLFLVNPHAGKAAIKTRMLPIIDTFVKAGYLPAVHITQRRGEIEEILPGIAHQYDMVVCSGGDGTINETINGMMNSKDPPVLGYIPAGTTNDFASSIGLPKNMMDAARAAVYGAAVSFDVGCFADRYFAYVAAFGAFTDVTYQTPQEQKNILGKMAYLLEGAARLPTLHSQRIQVEYDDKVVVEDVMLCIITNSSFVAGLPLGKLVDSSMRDGIMEVFLIRSQMNALALAPVINSFLVGEIDEKHVLLMRTKQIKVVSEQLIPWTLDGEFGGEHREVLIHNRPQILRIMVPEDTIGNKLTL